MVKVKLVRVCLVLVTVRVLTANVDVWSGYTYWNEDWPHFLNWNWAVPEEVQTVREEKVRVLG